MFEYLSNNPNFFKSNFDSIALYGQTPTASHLARLFSSVGLQVYLLPSNSSERCSSSTNYSLITDENDLPYLSSVLINCQNDYLSIKSLLNSLPDEYKQHMAYIECSSLNRENQIELIYNENKFSYYLCMSLIEYETSTMIQPHYHLISSGNKIVVEKLFLQTNIPAKITFLNQTKTPFDSYYICLLHRYSQAIHFLIYAEMMAILKSANPIYPGRNFDYFED